MAKTFKEVRKERSKIENKRAWEYDGFQFQSRIPTVKVELDADKFSRQVFFSSVEGEVLTESQLVEKAEKLDLLRKIEEEFGGKLDDVESEIMEEFVPLQDKLTTLAPPETSIEELQEQDNWDEIVELSNKVFELRKKLVRLRNLKSEYTSGSANDIADDMRQNYLTTECTFVDISDENEEPKWVRVWENVDDMLNDEDPLLVKAAKYQFYLLTLGLKDDESTINIQIPELRIQAAVDQERQTNNE